GDFRFHRGDLSLAEAEMSSDAWQVYDPVILGTARETGTYWFRMTLPDNSWRNPHMYVTYLPHGELYLDGQRLYAFHTELHNKQIHSNQPQLIQLPDNFSGKSLYIRSAFEQQWVHPG